MGTEVGGRFKSEGTYVYLWLIYVEVWQKPTQYYTAIIFQLKNKYLQVLQCSMTIWRDGMGDGREVQE